MVREAAGHQRISRTGEEMAAPKGLKAGLLLHAVSTIRGFGIQRQPDQLFTGVWVSNLAIVMRTQ